MMRLKSSSSSSTNPRPSYPSDPGREPTLTSSPETIALYSRSHHPPSLAVAQPTHSPQRVEAPHSPPYYSTSTPQPLSQEARETNCTFSFESSYRQQHHGRETAPFSPPNYSTSTTQPLSPEAGETNYTLSSMSSDRQRNTRQNRRAVPTSPQNYSTSTTQPMSPEPSDTNYTLSSRSGDHPHLLSRKTAKHKGQTFAIDEEQTAIGNEESMEISEESHWPSESKTQWKMAKTANPLPDRHCQRQRDQQRPFPIELLQQPQLHEHHPLSHRQKPQQQKKQKQAQPRPLPQPPQPQLPAREQRQPQQRESQMRKPLQLQPVTLEPGQQQIMQSQGRQQQVRHPQNRQQQDRQRQARHQESQQEDLKQYQQSSQQKSRRKKMDRPSQSFINLSTMEALEYEDGNASHIAVIHVSDPQQPDPMQSQGRQQQVRHPQNRQQQDRQQQARHQESQQEDPKQYQESSQQKSRWKKMDPPSQSFIDLSTMEALEYKDGNGSLPSHIAVIHVSDPQQPDPRPRSNRLPSSASVIVCNSSMHPFDKELFQTATATFCIHSVSCSPNDLQIAFQVLYRHAKHASIIHCYERFLGLMSVGVRR